MKNTLEEKEIALLIHGNLWPGRKWKDCYSQTECLNAAKAILAAMEEERGSKAEAIIRECEGFGYSRENVRHILHVAGYVTDERLPPLHTPPDRVSVPPEPTGKMVDAAPHFPGPPTSEGVRIIYRAMIAAAQEEG